MTVTVTETKLWKAAEAAERLNISERTLWMLTNSGEVPSVRIGRSLRYDPADLEAYIAAKKVKPHKRNPASGI